MNLHLISFFFNVFIWGVVGLGIAYIVEKTEGLSAIRYQYPIYLLVALTLGVFFSLNHALPEYGVSIPIFIEVCVGTILFAYGISQTFRKTALG
jgi:uncharacterized membrane protein YhfC